MDAFGEKKQSLAGSKPILPKLHFQLGATAESHNNNSTVSGQRITNARFALVSHAQTALPPVRLLDDALRLKREILAVGAAGNAACRLIPRHSPDSSAPIRPTPRILGDVRPGFVRSLQGFCGAF
jgi:hypothetical protein